jgi:hypothetical protein
MARYRSICAFIFAVALVPAACFAESHRSYDESNAVAIVISDHSQATFAGARAIVESTGARGVQMFPPDAIFGFFSERPDPSRFAGLDVELCYARADLRGAGLDGIVERVVGDLLEQEAIVRAARVAEPGAFEEGVPLEDRVLRVPEEIVRGTMPATDGPRRGSTMELADRSIRENSEFLIGSVLVNVIFPESEGTSEDWTEDEISGAISGIALGISQYMQKALWYNDLSFVYNYADFRRIPTSMEPIESDMSTDDVWIGEVLTNLGYPYGAYYGAHLLNNATRNVYGTDWVFTAFVADMSNHYSATPPSPDPGCWGGAGYVAYAYLGGPYLLVPYPACRYGYGLGFGRVFIHEMSHVFWALDEYASAEEGCGSKSGYLAVPNRNTLYMSCQATLPCIMQSSSPPFTEPQPICDYTQGQVGMASVDIGADTYLKIYSLPPTVEFTSIPGAIDTLLPGDEYFLTITIRNAAVPNQNPMQQEPPERVDYATPIKAGWLSVNGQGWQAQNPADPRWGHSSNIVISREVSMELDPGVNVVDFRAENKVGRSDTASKNLFLIGLKYNTVYATPVSDNIRVAWTTAVELFGAEFDVWRADLTTGGAETRLATVSTPDGIGNRRAYSYLDTSVVATRRYRYRLEGRFSIDFRGEHRDYAFSSQEVTATASVPIASGIVSNVLPNPTRDRVTFTVNVPKSYGVAAMSRDASDSGNGEGGARSAASSSSTLAEVRTPVDVVVYNVLGQRIKSIYSNKVFSGLMTFTWDGTDSNNRAVPAGVYFLRVSAGTETAVRKVVMVR